MGFGPSRERLERDDLYGFVRDGKVASQLAEPRTSVPLGRGVSVYVCSFRQLTSSRRLKADGIPTLASGVSCFIGA